MKIRSGLILFSLLLLGGCDNSPATITGYVEGEYLYFSPSTTGILAERVHRRGDEIKEGETLFSLDLVALKARLRSDEALLSREKAVRNASYKEWARVKKLVETGAVSRSEYDLRLKDVEEADATLKMAEETLVDDRQRIKEAAPKAPTDGKIEDIYFQVGETVPQGTPVVSFLPKGNLKLRFYVPQQMMALLKEQKKIFYSCDGCKETKTAIVRYIASEAEYTPPVIYSVGSRDKLVFRVEAYPDADTSDLKPGLPVDIRITMP
ncbi:MAG: efflux RND transporter periplasmic adaptor subunit [Alphaproteobacteria bacterium]|nr:efflux RND transporter periplasmic adaptor subunit [Alphaproteobacteria bacterium]